MPGPYSPGMLHWPYEASWQWVQAARYQVVAGGGEGAGLGPVSTYMSGRERDIAGWHSQLCLAVLGYGQKASNELFCAPACISLRECFWSVTSTI